MVLITQLPDGLIRIILNKIRDPSDLENILSLSKVFSSVKNNYNIYVENTDYNSLMNKYKVLKNFIPYKPKYIDNLENCFEYNLKIHINGNGNLANPEGKISILLIKTYTTRELSIYSKDRHLMLNLNDNKSYEIFYRDLYKNFEHKHTVMITYHKTKKFFRYKLTSTINDHICESFDFNFDGKMIFNQKHYTFHDDKVKLNNELSCKLHLDEDKNRVKEITLNEFINNTYKYQRIINDKIINSVINDEYIRQEINLISSERDEYIVKIFENNNEIDNCKRSGYYIDKLSSNILKFFEKKYIKFIV